MVRVASSCSLAPVSSGSKVFDRFPFNILQFIVDLDEFLLVVLYQKNEHQIDLYEESLTLRLTDSLAHMQRCPIVPCIL